MKKIFSKPATRVRKRPGLKRKTGSSGNIMKGMIWIGIRSPI